MNRVLVVVGLAVLLVLGIGGWFVFQGRGAEMVEPEDSVAEVNELVPEGLDPEPVTAARVEEPAPAEPEEDGVPEDPVAPVAPPAVPEPVLLNGTAVRVDAGGHELAGEDGRFRLIVLEGANPSNHEVEVRGGSWSTEVMPGHGLIVDGLVLGDVPVTLEQRDFVVPEDRFLALKGTGLQTIALHVLSEKDRTPLSGIEIWPGPYRFPTNLQHPGSEPEGTPIVRGASSPVELAPNAKSWRGARQVFVRAPGHAWGSIALEHTSGGERTLVLPRASKLTVELIGNAEWLDPTVRLWPPRASRWDAYPHAARQVDADDRAEFGSLAPGTYFASVERGWADRRVSYGNTTIELAAGDDATVQIEVQLPKQPIPVNLSGTLVLPLGWADEERALVLGGEGATEMWLDEAEFPLAQMEELEEGYPEDCLAYAWEIELPREGKYRLVLPQLYRTLLDVPEGGLEGIEIVIPPPADVEVRVIDVDTEEELEVEALRWSLPRVEGILATRTYTAVREPETRRVHFRAPAERVKISQTELSILAVDDAKEYPLQPGFNSVELRVRRLIGVRFTLKDGDATVPWNWTWRISAHREDGVRDRARSVGHLWFLEGGTYELRTQKGIPGFQSIEGMRIEVPEEGLSDVAIDLVRE